MKDPSIILDMPDVIVDDDSNLCIDGDITVNNRDDEFTFPTTIKEDHIVKVDNIKYGLSSLWLICAVWLCFAYIDRDRVFFKEVSRMASFVRFLLFILTPLLVCIYVIREICSL